MIQRLLVLVAFIALCLFLLPSDTPNKDFQTPPTLSQSILQIQAPVLNPATAGNSIRTFYDPTANFMGNRSHVNPPNDIYDLAPALSESSLYQDTLGHVALHYGLFYHSEIVHHVPSRGFDFNLILTYNSGYTGSDKALLGDGWDHNFNAFVVYDSTNDFWTLSNGFGQQIDFLATTTSGYYYAEDFHGNYSVLWVDSMNEKVFIRNRHGMLTTFDTSVLTNTGILDEIRDANDNFMDITNNSSGFVTSVTDTLGRTYTFHYDLTTGELKDIMDFNSTSRTVLFNVANYSGSTTLFKLGSIEYVEVSGTSTGNDFDSTNSNRKSTTFDYNGTSADPAMLMTKIKHANEIAPSGGSDFLTVAYYNSTSSNPGFVNTLTVGTTNYLTSIPSSNLSFSWTTGNICTVTDRNGNSTVYTIGAEGQVAQVVEQTSSGTATTTANYSNGEVTDVTQPWGNTATITRSTSSASRYSQGNMTQIDFQKDSTRFADQTNLIHNFVWEPIYNSVYQYTDPNSNNTLFLQDYFEETSATTINNTFAAEFFNEITTFTGSGNLLDSAVFPQIQSGELNGDQNSNQFNGNIIAKVHADCTIPDFHDGTTPTPGPLDGYEGDSNQEAAATFTYNSFGQMTSSMDEEENVTFYAYYGTSTPGSGTIGIGGGYLARTIQDSHYPHPHDSNIVRRPTSQYGDIDRQSGQGSPPSATSGDFTQITTTLEYNSNGVVTKITNPRGVVTEYEVNQLDQVVKETRSSQIVSVTGGGYADHVTTQKTESGLSALSYETRYFYDGNNNLIATLVENDNADISDSALSPVFSYSSNVLGVSGSTGFIETYYFHDILGNLRHMQTEITSGVSAETAYEYDKNENRTLLQYPEAVAGNDTNNTESWTYEPRDLVDTYTRGVTSTLVSTVSYDYDVNRNRITFTDADNSDVTSFEFDGHDRHRATSNPVSTTIIKTFDAASNVVFVETTGYIDGSATTAETLSSVTYEYDERNRMIRTIEDLLISSNVSFDRTPNPDPDHFGMDRVAATLNLDRLSRTVFVIEEDLDYSENTYDGASRLINTKNTNCNCAIKREMFYDDNSNLVRTIETDAPTNTGLSLPSTQTFLHVNDYDSVDRGITSIQYAVDSTVAPNGPSFTSRFVYDSRGLMRFSADAKGPANAGYTNTVGESFSNANGHGNVTHNIYDTAGRLIQSDRVLTSNGQGSGNFSPTPDTAQGGGDGLVSIQKDWDLNSRLISETDDNANTTQYNYDELNRRDLITYADTSTRSYSYNRDHSMTGLTDQNGSMFTNTYDTANRLTNVNVNQGSGVLGLSTSQDFEYDGLNRMTFAFDNNDPLNSGDNITCIYRYNSRSQLLEEEQDHSPLNINPKAISADYVDESDRSVLYYPKDVGATDTAPRVEYGWDAQDRIGQLDFVNSTISGTASFTFDFYGNRDLQCVRSTGVDLRYHDQAGTLTYDAARRPTRKEDGPSTGSPYNGFDYTWDRMNNRLTEDRTDFAPLYQAFSPGLTKNWAPLAGFGYDSAYRLRSELCTFVGSINVQINLFAHDGAQNRTNCTFGFGGAGFFNNLGSQSYTANSENEYTAINSVSPVNDANGNLTDDGTFTFQYDAHNRLRTATRKSDSNLVGTYNYDATGRRVERIVTNSPGLDTHIIYYYDGPEVIEEYGPTGALIGGEGEEETSRRDPAEIEDLFDTEDNDPKDSFRTATSLSAPSAFTAGSAGALLRRYVWRTNPIDYPMLMEEFEIVNGIRLYYHTNELGDVKIMTLQNGTPILGYEYDTFGKIGIWSIGATLQTGTPIINPYLFQCKRLDPETKDIANGDPEGMYESRARMYDPLTGRFLSNDPLGIWHDAVGYGNAFTAVGNNPANWIDPYGLQRERGKRERELLRKIANAQVELEEIKDSIASGTAIQTYTELDIANLKHSLKKIEARIDKCIECLTDMYKNDNLTKDQFAEMAKEAENFCVSFMNDALSFVTCGYTEGCSEEASDVRNWFVQQNFKWFEIHGIRTEVLAKMGSTEISTHHLNLLGKKGESVEEALRNADSATVDTWHGNQIVDPKVEKKSKETYVSE